MKSVEGPHRLARKRLPRALGDLTLNGKERPVLGGEAKLRPQVRSPRFGKHRIVGGSNQGPFALDQRELGSKDELRAGKGGARDVSRRFPEKPCQAGIVRSHPFVDGNKRTGFVIGILLLQLNGYRLQAELSRPRYFFGSVGSCAPCHTATTQIDCPSRR